MRQKGDGPMSGAEGRSVWWLTAREEGNGEKSLDKEAGAIQQRAHGREFGFYTTWSKKVLDILNRSVA